MSASELSGAIPGLEVREKIGSGGMGAVFKAYQPLLDRVVALKTVRPELLTPDGLQLFQREARLLARCSHPNIVRILEFHAEPPTPHFLMEYVDGIPLDQATKGRTWKEKARLFHEVVATVASAHEQGVVHGDLKPPNILVDRRFQPHVLDFGLARLSHGEAQHTDQFGGTPNYLAPEVYGGSPTSILTDIYALGVTLYQVLTGLLPWKTRDEARAGRARLPVEHNPDIPEPLQRICLKAMEPRPEDRYQTAEQLQHDLERFGVGKPIFVRPTRYLEELDRRVENHLRDIQLWEREGFINQRERDGVVQSYQGILGGDSPWLSESRTLLTGTMLIRVGSWCLLISSLLWPVFYWHQMSEPARLAATGVPAVVMIALGAIYLARRERRYALACLGSSVLLILVFEITLMAEFRWLEYRQRPEWEASSSWLSRPPTDQELDTLPLGPGEELDEAEMLRAIAKARANQKDPDAPPDAETERRKGKFRLPGRPTLKQTPQPDFTEPLPEPRDWGDRKEFLLANSQVFFAALTAILCLSVLLAGLRAPFFAPWLAIACLALFCATMLLVGDKERLLHGKVAWVALHYLGFAPGFYLLGYALERRAGPRVARPIYVLAAITGVVAAVTLARFGTAEWSERVWGFDETVWNLWLAAYSVPFFLWAWLTERSGTEGQRILTWWLYLLVPIFLLFPLQMLFAKGPTLFTVGSQPLHLYAALFVVACAAILILGRILHLELFLVAAMWSLAVWVFRMTYRHFWEQEGWAIAVALTGTLLVGLGVWRSRRNDRIPEAPRRRARPQPEVPPAASSVDEIETAALRS